MPTQQALSPSRRLTLKLDTVGKPICWETHLASLAGGC